MTPLTEAEIRRAFVNCSQGEAKRLRIPLGLADTPRGRPSTSSAGATPARRLRRALCSTVHSTTDVALMVAPRPGASGRNGNTVGTYLCTDLACSLYARHLKRPERVQPVETLSTEKRIERVRTNLDTFVGRVVGAAGLAGPRNG
jgi:hypothetical protein